MLQNWKPYVVVLVLSSLVLLLARPYFLRFTAKDDYDRRAIGWLLLTSAGFLSPSIWLYCAIALPVMVVAAQRDRNALAFYALVMYAVPPTSIPIPMVGINQLFDISQLRLLSLAVLLPLVLQRRELLPPARTPALRMLDIVLLLYLGLTIVLLMSYESGTNSLRRAFLALIDTGIVFYAFSRFAPTPERLREVMAMVVLMCLVAAPIAIFESAKGWLLYTNINEMWGDPNRFAYLLRGGTLRAQVGFGHSLEFGYLTATSVVFALYLNRFHERRWLGRVVLVLLAGALIAAYARGPWLVALLSIAAFHALRPGGMSRVLKLGTALAVVFAAVLVSPIGSQVIDAIPFIGSLDAQNIEYRQRLFNVSLLQIEQHPILGNPFVLLNMEELRQGQGIIDIVNGYLRVALFYGLFGLALFAALLLGSSASAWLTMRRAFAAPRGAGQGLGELGACLLAAMLGTMLFIATAGFGTFTFLLTGLTAGYASFAAIRRTSAAAAAAAGASASAPARGFTPAGPRTT